MVSVPAISVVMPLYRGQKFLRESIDSVLRQTFGDFEFLVIVDDATEETRRILDEYKKVDSRIIVYYNDGIGLIDSLNLGFKAARGKYIARMDSDDICLPARLEKQFRYMEEHPGIGVLGTGFEIINGNGDTMHVFRPIDNPGLIRWRLIYDNCLTHSSVIIRKSILKKIGCYRSNARYAEDYDLWVRASRVTDISNHCDILMKYRVHDESVSMRKFEEQEKTVREIVSGNIRHILNADFTLDEIGDIRTFARGNRLDDPDKIRKSIKILLNLYSRYLHDNRLKANEISLITNDLSVKMLKSAVREYHLPVFARTGILCKAVGLKLKSYPLMMKRQKIWGN